MSFSTLGLKPKPKEITKPAEKASGSIKPTDRLKPKTVDLVKIIQINSNLFLIISPLFELSLIQEKYKKQHLVQFIQMVVYHVV